MGKKIEKLTREEKRMVNVLFNSLFSMEYKIKAVKLLTRERTHIYLNEFRNDEIKINEMFDCLFTFEDKIEGIKLHYKVRGYKFKTIKELYENRNLLKED